MCSKPRKHTQQRARNRRQKDANERTPETVTTEVIRFLTTFQPHSRKAEYLKEVVLSKFVSDDTDPADVRRQRAINKWLATERENEATNDRLLILSEEYNILPRVSWHQFRTHAQRLIAQLLGDTVPIEALLGGFSGGASTTKSRTESHPALKYLGKAEITSAARTWFDLVLTESWLWREYASDLQVSECRGNILFTVPKTTEIDRCAAKEPDLNMYLQKGVGNFVRRRLKTVGINLNDQTRNQRLAREGSVTGRLATLDLSSASDSISIECVSSFLPPLWAGLLSDLRSPETNIDGVWHKNHMFSSMGNGFTFEIESLLFWAIARTCRDLTGYRGVVSVYGDDLIVESGVYPSLVEALKVLGFSVNTDKSFSEGPFRESCGGHYHNGYDISPFYLRRPLKKVRDVIVLANHIRLWSQSPDMGILDPTLEELWLFLHSFVPRSLRGGFNLESDSQLVSNEFPEKQLVAVSVSRDNGVGGYLLWLDTCEDSSERRDVIITSERSIPTGRYRARRISKHADVRKLPCLFLSEYDVQLAE